MADFVVTEVNGKLWPSIEYHTGKRIGGRERFGIEMARIPLSIREQNLTLTQASALYAFGHLEAQEGKKP